MRLAPTLLAVAALLAAPLSGEAHAQGPGIEGCIPCHGSDGIAHDAEVPNLAAQNAPYLYNQLKAFKSGSRRHPEMRFMSRHMTDAEMQALAEYYGSLPAR
jgi:cytochrome c553